jgi:hypothetical protein
LIKKNWTFGENESTKVKKIKNILPKYNIVEVLDWPEEIIKSLLNDEKKISNIKTYTSNMWPVYFIIFFKSKHLCTKDRYQWQPGKNGY